ncbi:hypothetical protein FRC19_000847 [Serendipita sp. 401]|nr:hypothetical protein FRC19_000847 [Serendipita sp. 401]KAG8838521.1 hypothetical protein FRC18_004153 [Serendipita sp. 400]KAG9057083.1 hypothetical protein FS842_008654 [Serendipita sp. 407]
MKYTTLFVPLAAFAGIVTAAATNTTSDYPSDSADRHGKDTPSPSSPFDSVPPSSAPTPTSVPGPASRHMRRIPYEEGNQFQCGMLRVQAEDNAFSGYIAGMRDRDGRYIVTKDASRAAQVKLVESELLLEPRDQSMGYARIGATFGLLYEQPGDNNMEGNSFNYAYISGTDRTAVGSPASMGRSSFNDATSSRQRIESSIFYFGENKEVRAQWVNTNRAIKPVTFAVNPSFQLVISGNPGAYVSKFGGKAARIFCTPPPAR